MSTKQIVGIVLGVAGVLVSFTHLALMMIFHTSEPYHGLGTWVMLGLALAVVGILLIRKREPK